MLWVCDSCTTRYAPAPSCPHCRSTDHHELGTEPVPKTTVKNGPSIAAAPGGAVDAAPTSEEPAGDNPPETPTLSAPKSEWHAFAAAHGADEETLSGTKTEIVAWVRAAGLIAD